MSDDQDTTAKKPVQVTIKQEFAHQCDPDRVVHWMRDELQKMAARQTAQAAAFAMYMAPKTTEERALHAKLARRARWRRRIRKAALFVAWGCVTSLAILGACWLLGVPRP